MFDVVAASTLCEKPEYEACGAVVGLSVAQAWAQALQVGSLVGARVQVGFLLKRCWGLPVV